MTGEARIASRILTATGLTAGLITGVGGGTSAATAATTAPTAAPTVTRSAGGPLRTVIAELSEADERREGYVRTKFRHWVDADTDGCNTRAEVLLAEAVDAPQQGARCRLTGGRWYSYYDDVTVTDPGRLDIDHMVPLAEVWDSGAHDWTPARRQAYANDLADDRTLVAVTARSNRSKSDQDPREWLPPHQPAICRYITDWAATKLRWSLTVDPAEKQALTRTAADCPNTTMTVAPATDATRQT